MSARILDLPPGTPSPARVLSKTTASILLNKSPLHARLRKLRQVPDETTDEMDQGTILHAMLLGVGKAYAVAEYAPPATADEQLAAMVADYEDAGDVPEPAAKGTKKPRKVKPPEPPPNGPDGRPEWQNWMRGDAKAARDLIRSKGMIPLLPKEKRIYEASAKKLREELERWGIVFNGRSEVAIEWSEFASDGDEVTCWGALDHIKAGPGFERAEIYDLKIVDSAHPRAIQKHLVTYAGDVQAVAYTRAVEAYYPQFAGCTTFTFLFCEPFSGIVQPVRLSGEFRRLGELKWLRAVETWARCLREDDWPGYATETLTIEPPQWAMADEMDATHEADPLTRYAEGETDDE